MSLAREPQFVFANSSQALQAAVNILYKQGFIRLPIFTPMKLTDGRWVDIVFPKELVH